MDKHRLSYIVTVQIMQHMLREIDIAYGRCLYIWGRIIRLKSFNRRVAFSSSLSFRVGVEMRIRALLDGWPRKDFKAISPCCFQ